MSFPSKGLSLNLFQATGLISVLLATWLVSETCSAIFTMLTLWEGPNNLASLGDLLAVWV